MSEAILIIFFCTLVLCIILFFMYFSFIFRHVLSMKRNAEFMNQMQMHPLQLERFSTSDGDDFETETTSLCVPPTVSQNPPHPQIAPISERQMKRTRSSFFQLPRDSYFKFSLVDDYQSPDGQCRNPSEIRVYMERDATKANDKRGEDNMGCRRKNTWEKVVSSCVGENNSGYQNHYVLHRDKLPELVCDKLPCIREHREYLI